MFWSRLLLPEETAFVRRFFGASLDALLPRMRVHVRRMGDTRRALSMNGGRIYLPRSFFEHQNPRQPLRLMHSVVAGIFAHELLHQWQRLQGRAVTREAFWLHLKAACLRCNPYHYEACAQPEAMLQRFMAAGVEQQGQIWEDHVRAAVQGQPLACMVQVAEYVKGAKAKPLQG